MPSDHLPEPLADTLRRHCNVNAFTSDWPESLRRELNHPDHPDRAAKFQRQLAEAILLGTLTAAQYERLTGEDFDSQQDLTRRLREIWSDLYGVGSIEDWLARNRSR